MRFYTILRDSYEKIKNAQRTVSLHTRVPRSHLQELLGEYDPEEHDARYGPASPRLYETLPAENAPDPVAEAEQEELLADIRRLFGSVFASDEKAARIAEGLFVRGETPAEVARAVLKTQYGVQLVASRIIRVLQDPANSGKIVGHLD